MELLIECLLLGPWWVWAVWLRQRTEKVNGFSHGNLKERGSSVQGSESPLFSIYGIAFSRAFNY